MAQESMTSALGSMPKNQSRPELEDGLARSEYLRCRESLRSATTSVDVLEIARKPESEAKWQGDLDHAALSRRFEVRSGAAS